MKIGGKNYQSIWRKQHTIFIIDQTQLPQNLVIQQIRSAEEIARAIKNMHVRGAPLIGVTAAYGVALGLLSDPSDKNIEFILKILADTRPTAINLLHALKRMEAVLKLTPLTDRVGAAWVEADKIAQEDINQNLSLGNHGLRLIEEISKYRKPINILTHCNAGWLATVDFGTALAPIFLAHKKGIELHIWVDETRPRNQGLLTAWELASNGVPYTLIVDNAGGHLMQKKQVDMVIVGADRVSANGDVCNKIGTYLKALSARDNHVPFYAAVPSPTIDWQIQEGFGNIPIEERSQDEILMNSALSTKKKYSLHGVGHPNTLNPAFDITPARLVTGLITDKGVIQPISSTTMMQLKQD